MTRVIEDALRLHDWGYSLVPLKANSKLPAGPWGHLQIERMTREQVQTTIWENIGIIGGDIVIFDNDGTSDNLPDTPMEVITRNGGHKYFHAPHGLRVQNRVRINGEPMDVRGFGGYAVAPSSSVNGFTYKWKKGPVPKEELPLIPVELLPKKEIITDLKPDGDPILRGRAYISKIFADSGNGGHHSTFRAVCKLRHFGVTKGEAFALLLEWNTTNATPPWSVPELRHKLNDAFGE